MTRRASRHPRVELYIETVVVEGIDLSRAQRQDLGVALSAQLTDLLPGGLGQGPVLARAARVPEVVLEVEPPPGDPDGVGRSIGSALAGELIPRLTAQSTAPSGGAAR